MAMRKFESTMNVVDAAKIRIKNAFASNKRVYLAFSSGKDSLCLSSLVYDLIMQGEIDRNLLTVFFIDEEGIYPSMVEQAERWRNNFMRIGVPFWWFCLPFKQVSVIDSLSADESWITWEPGKEDVWMRKMPEYAITSSPFLHYAGEMNYQTFAEKAFGNDIRLVGLRTAESYTRLKSVTERANPNMVYPIYDWKDTDVWRYIRDHNLEFPKIYMEMYEAGASKKQMRLCAFFGEGGTNGLLHLAETDPDLWARMLKREPNVYLARLYWDSEMFQRNTRNRKKLEAEQEKKDYKALVEDMLFVHPENYRITGLTKKNLKSWKSFYARCGVYLSQKTCQKIYEGLVFGDPKGRLIRLAHMMAGADRREAMGVEEAKWSI